MVLLSTPHTRFHRSFLAAADEFRAAGEAQHDGVVNWPAEGDFPGVVFTREALDDPAEFERLVANRVGDADEASPRPPGWSSATYWWMEDAERPHEYVGSISLRHRIDHPLLASIGGHVGYGVRPGARRRGYASDALRQVVPLAAARGIEREQSGKRRYWIETGA